MLHDARLSTLQTAVRKSNAIDVECGIWTCWFTAPTSVCYCSSSTVCRDLGITPCCDAVHESTFEHTAFTEVS